MGIAPRLIPLALAKVGDLGTDDAKEAALRALLAAINPTPDPPEAIAEAFASALAAARALGQRGARARVFADACAAITTSQLPLARRHELLDRAVELARAVSDPAERVEASVAAIEARIALHGGDDTVEALEDLLRVAGGIEDEDERARAVLVAAGALVQADETDRAREAALPLPLSGARALVLARAAFARAEDGVEADTEAELADALAELRFLDDSYDKALTVRHVLAHAVRVGSEPAIIAALAVADGMIDSRLQKDALTGALNALPLTPLEGSELHQVITRIGMSVSRIGDYEMRAEMLGSFALHLASLSQLETCLALLGEIVCLPTYLGDLSAALPLPGMLGALADVGLAPEELDQFAGRALDLLGILPDELGVAVLLRDLTRFFASPALPYATRVSLFDRALFLAQRFESDKVRVEVVAHIANGLSIAGATERGDALFAGLVSGIGPNAARPVRLSRAVALVRLGRTAEARAEIAAAAAFSGQSWHAVEELAKTNARCGFLADMLTEIERIDPEQRAISAAQVADALVEATYLDPHLRQIGLSSLLDRAEGPVREAIACLLDQVRVLEGLGDTEEIISAAFERTAAIENREAAALFERQLVSALVERIASTTGAAAD